MPRQFDASATLHRRIKFLEERIARDRAEIEQHREALKVYAEALGKLKPLSGPSRRK